MQTLIKVIIVALIGGIVVMSWFEYVAKKKKGEYNVRKLPFVLPVAK